MHDPIQHVLGRIERGELRMRSKISILVATAALAAASATVFVLAIYLVSFGIFSLRTSGALLLPSFGLRGVRMFFAAFPWAPAGGALVLMIILVRLARLLPFVYRRPIGYAALGALALSGAIGLALDQTALHGAINDRTTTGGLRVLDVFYAKPDGMQSAGTYVGIVTTASSDAFLLQTDAGEVVVQLTPETRYPQGRTIGNGDRVLVIGDRQDGIVTAYGIRVIAAESK
ncbi:MAG: hypothetical protein Q7T01_00480 [bacterium]|nr:hypothetical protein [bacterium]